jgi:uroporphyrinogen decarboxylase
VFNLGHGIHPAIPPEHAGAMIEAVHELSRPYHQ